MFCIFLHIHNSNKVSITIAKPDFVRSTVDRADLNLVPASIVDGVGICAFQPCFQAEQHKMQGVDFAYQQSSSTALQYNVICFAL